MLPREFFPNHELVCHCGCGLMPPIESVERLYAVRAILGVPLTISSAARCKAQNKIAGGANGSIHLLPSQRHGDSSGWGGGAFDVLAKPALQARIHAAALIVGFRGFGWADGFIHIDDATRPEISYWRY